MSPQKSTVSTNELDGLPATESELNIALVYAKDPEGKYKRDIDRDLLRLIVNTAIERRRPGVILPFLVAEIAREVIPLSEKKDALKYEAYKGAAMKIFSERSAWKSKGAAHKRRRATEEAQRSKDRKTRHPEDARPKYKGQYKLL